MEETLYVIDSEAFKNSYYNFLETNNLTIEEIACMDDHLALDTLKEVMADTFYNDAASQLEAKGFCDEQLRELLSTARKHADHVADLFVNRKLGIDAKFDKNLVTK